MAATAARSLLIVTLASFSALAAFNVFHVQATNGLGKAMKQYSTVAGGEGYPGAPKPFVDAWTGKAALDGILTKLIGFFSAMLDGDVAPRYRAFAVWSMVQFGACCSIMLVEGLRKGNRGKAAGWVCTASIVVQVLSYMLIQPLWAILHVLTSNVASTTTTAEPTGALSVLGVDDLWSLAVFPITVLVTNTIPLLMMYLPSPEVFSARQHFGLIAFWQPFPIYHFIVHTVLSRLGRLVFGPLRPKDSRTGEPLSKSRAYLVYARSVYNFVTAVGAMVQLPILVLVLLPDSLCGAIRDILPASLKFYLGALLIGTHSGGGNKPADFTLQSIFAPKHPLASPVVDPDTIQSGQLAPLAVHFMHYDVYVGGGALLLWALYLYTTTTAATRKSNPGVASLLSVFVQSAVWFCVGGPAGAIASILWQRDIALLSQTGPQHDAKGRSQMQKKKKNA